MLRFREISETTARCIDRAIASMANLDSFEELEERFISEAGRLLPADCMCWNNWTTDLAGMISYRNNESYQEPFGNLLDVFAEVVGNHPLIAAGQFPDSVREVKRISDFQTNSKFRENPLFKEVYRHLDAHYQIAYTPCILRDRALILTWNRRAMDFSKADMQVMHLLGTRLAVIARRLEEKRFLEKSWRSLCGHVDSKLALESVSSLGEKDIAILTGMLGLRPRAEIARTSGIRRDSLDKRLGSIREKLGLENHHQLISALAGIKNAHHVSGAKI